MTSQANTIQALIKPKFARPLKYIDTKKAFKLLNLNKTGINTNQTQEQKVNRLERYQSEAIVHWNRFNRVR